MEYNELKKINDEMPRTQLDNGKMYAEVPQRVQAFRKLFPNGGIVTELISDVNGVATIKATITDSNGMVLACGHAFEERKSNMINNTSYLENAETSAVGRALGFLGIGSEASIASAEEVRNARAQQNEQSKEPAQSAPTPSSAPSAKKASEKQISYLTNLLEKKGVSLKKVAAMNNLADLKEMSVELADKLIKQYSA